jgi:hypothetical protein
MSTWFGDKWAYVLSLIEGLDVGSILSFLGRKLLDGLFQAVTVVVIGWLVLYRQWRQLTHGKSDQVIFSANLFTRLDAQMQPATDEEQYVLQLRTVLAPKTIDQLLDNGALRRLMRNLAETATVEDPILATEGTAGFEIVNDIVNNVSGSLASSPFRRDQWLMAVTCEDRRVVRKCCIRVLLVRRADLERMASWEWCRGHILVESWYHYWRIVTLHQLALRFGEEQARAEKGSASDIMANLLPMVDRQAHHRRIRILSLGLNVDEPIIKTPLPVDWDRYLPQVAELGLKLPGATTSAQAKPPRPTVATE